MQIGTVIVYRERSRLALGAIHKAPSTTPSGKPQVEIVGEDGKKSILIPDRIFLDCKQTLSPSLPVADLKEFFRQLRSQIEAQATAVNIKELWELLQDENEEDAGTFSWQELAGYLVPPEDPVAMASVLDALWTDTIHFKEKQLGIFTPRDAKSVEELVHQQEMERQRVQAQGEFLAWVQAQSAQQASLGIPAPSGSERFLNLLKGLALHGDQYDKKPQALKLLEATEFRSKGHSWDVAFQLLVALGIWKADEELSIHRYQIQTRFPDDVLQAAENASAFTSDQPAYTDLTDLLTFTIDDADTTEIDDALSLSQENGKLLVGVHITDAGFFVPPDSLLDSAALSRGTTVYLPAGKLPMLPAGLSEDTASLVADTLRPTLSFFASLDENGQLHTEKICRGIIKVGRRLSYPEADGLLQTQPAFDSYASALQQLLPLTHLRRARRIANGAVIIEGNEVKVRVHTNNISDTSDIPDISVMVFANDSPSRRVVSECMILANEIAARYCQQHQLPALYIGQPPPDEAVPKADDFPTRQVYIHAARRQMKPSQIGTTPAAHSALGLDIYTQITSPLRRYHDLQMHHQIKHHLANGTPLFDEERLQMIAASAQESSSHSKKCERESTRYWLLRYLERQKGQQVSGQIVREFNRRSFVELDETLLSAPVQASPRLPLGTPVHVTIGHVDARRDMLSVRLA